MLGEYNIKSFPTMLIFDSDGKPLAKTIGVDSKAGTEGFIKTIKGTLNKDKQYYKLLDGYEKGNHSDAQLKNLSIAAFYAGEYLFSDRIFKEYLHATNNNKSNIEKIKFLGEMSRVMKDTAYQLLAKHYSEYDHITNDPISSDKVREVVFYDVANGFIFKGRGQVENFRYYLKEPDWNILSKRLDSLCPDFSQEVLLYAKIQFYKYQANWKDCLSNIELFMEKYSGHVNAENKILLANDVYMHTSSNKDKLLVKSLDWVDCSLRLKTSSVGTALRSKILIKLGQ